VVSDSDAATVSDTLRLPTTAVQGNSRLGLGRRINIPFLLLSADVAALALSLVAAAATAALASRLLFHMPFGGFQSVHLPLRLATWLILFSAICAWFFATGHYTIRRPLRDEVPRVIGAMVLALLVDGFVQFAAKADFSRGWLMSLWFFAILCIPLCRLAARSLLDWIGAWRLDALVLGSGTHRFEVVSGLQGNRYLGYRFHLDDQGHWFSATDRHELAGHLKTCMQRNAAKTLVLVPSIEEFDRIDRLVDVLNFNLVPYMLVPPIHRLPLAGLDTQALLSSDAVLMTVRSGLLSPVSRVLKRTFDIVAASALVVFFTPLLLLLAGLIVLDGGAVTYSHCRVGRAGVPFGCRKFRTMVPDSDAVLKRVLAENPALREEWEASFKLKDDPRVTWIGKHLRKYSLDELPQLLNVIGGTMSLVGPRPVVADELERFYGDDALYYKLVRPGITGLWQISGRSDVGYERRVHLDAWYVRNWNLWDDVLILLGTLPSVIRSKGAY
jgi:undecaprenyl-phosphate galactose phosphotransferase